MRRIFALTAFCLLLAACGHDEKTVVVPQTAPATVIVPQGATVICPGGTPAVMTGGAYRC